MIIGIDGNEANVKNRVGSNIYSFELIQALYKLKPKVTVYLRDKRLVDLPKPTSWWQYRMVGPRKFWTQFGLPLALYLHRPRPDVFFTPGHYSPRWAPCPTVMSIMDLSYIHFPQMFKKRDLWQLKNWTAHSVKKAKKIFTISKHAKNAIISYYHLKPQKIVVTYPGLKMYQAQKRANLKKYGVKGDYILYVGTLQPRKNLLRLIKAHSILISQYPNLQLVIVGKKGWLYQEIFAKVKELGLTKSVIFTGFIPDEDLPTFYQNALCFVLVSLYEGFGLPVLESMHYGCPVVTSNVSSLPEVVGQAGILVNPKSVVDIAEGMKKAINNRKELIKKGHQQVKKFSWEKCAKETLEVLEGVKSGNI